VEVHKRLGNIKGGAQTVKSHKWFQHINWDDLYHRRTPGPIIPQLKHAADTTNFDEYEPEPECREPYTDELRNKFESEFEDF